MPVVINRWHLKQAACAFKQGGTIAYPTESVYGLGCDPENPEAVHELLAIKNRPADMGLILIAAELQQLQPYLSTMNRQILDRMVATWPGPVTWLVPARPEVPEWIRGAHDTVAVRITAHPVAAALCAMIDTPLVSTSANIHGGVVARNMMQVRRIFGDAIAYILPGHIGGLKNPTEIRDALTNKVIRPV